MVQLLINMVEVEYQETITRLWIDGVQIGWCDNVTDTSHACDQSYAVIVNEWLIFNGWNHQFTLVK